MGAKSFVKQSKLRSILVVCFLVLILDIIIQETSFNYGPKMFHQLAKDLDCRHHDEQCLLSSSRKVSLFDAFRSGVLLVEAGKKKKKEKSEVVVISVNNPRGHSGGMYPVFIPSCGGGGHFGGGYGRRR